MNDYSAWVTLRELDQRSGLAKGTAFRAFKSMEPSWIEGRDYCVLSLETHSAEIENLRRLHRLYDNSVKAILLSLECAAQVTERLQCIR